ncbi:MAG: aminoacyl-tRNA hydrolase [Planctomycetaceae bacterium]|nr:aminoacyl-tRNA hydrolase [Planctomycetaceae bacterium]
MKIVVGLGNPGAKYRGTRHNVGYEVLAELANRHGGASPILKHDAELVEIFLGGEKVLLVAPQTYMNLSGRSVWPLVDFYKLPLDDLLIICDDLNLDVGRLRLRPSGSAGGQNGIKHIIQQLGSQEFPRLRIGIGRPPGRMDAAAYVLARFLSEEREMMDEAILSAADGVELWVREGCDKAMNRINSIPKEDK